MIPTYLELIQLTRGNINAIELVLAEHHDEFGEDADALRMANHHHPVSIKQCEARYIYNFIKRHQLTAGYEVATAFGISALYAGLAFKETGGHLITLDCFVEENFNLATAYKKENLGDYSFGSDGKKSAEFLFRELGVPVELKVGVSPDNVDEILSNYPSMEFSLDYAFIDAQHTDEAVIADIDAIAPRLSRDGFALFLHDMHCFTSKVQDHIRSLFNKEIKLCDGCGLPRGYNLSLITNLKD